MLFNWGARYLAEFVYCRAAVDLWCVLLMADVCYDSTIRADIVTMILLLYEFHFLAEMTRHLAARPDGCVAEHLPGTQYEDIPLMFCENISLAAWPQ